MKNLPEAIKEEEEKKPVMREAKSEQESGVKTEQVEQKSAVKSSTNTPTSKETHSDPTVQEGI